MSTPINIPEMKSKINKTKKQIEDILALHEKDSHLPTKEVDGYRCMLLKLSNQEIFLNKISSQPSSQS